MKLPVPSIISLDAKCVRRWYQKSNRLGDLLAVTFRLNENDIYIIFGKPNYRCQEVIAILYEARDAE